MAQEYWVCEKCGTRNSINDGRCSGCHKKISKRELADALNRIEAADAYSDDAFDRFKKRAMMSEEEFQEDLERPQTRRSQAKNKAASQRSTLPRESFDEEDISIKKPSRLSQMASRQVGNVKEKWAYQNRQRGVLKVIHYITAIALFASIVVFIYSLFTFIASTNYSEVGEVFSKLFSSIGNIFKNTFNYFLNIQFSNNAIARMGGIVGKNLMQMFTAIYNNILRFLSML